MQCEHCSRPIHHEFGPDKDYCLYGKVVTLPDGKWELIKHQVCIDCYRKVMNKTETRSTKLT